MAEGTDNVEDHISCDDSSYGERNLEVYNSGDGVNSGSKDKEYGGVDMIRKVSSVVEIARLSVLGEIL